MLLKRGNLSILIVLLLISSPAIASAKKKFACGALIAILGSVGTESALERTGYRIDLGIIKNGPDYESIDERRGRGENIPSSDYAEPNHLDLRIVKPYPQAHYAWDAYRKGREHIGYGIYFHLPSILNTVLPETRNFFENAKGDPNKLDEVSRILMFYLNGDYEKTFDDRNPLPRNAENFFDGQSRSRGVCRHKATVMAAILVKLGYDAVVVSGELPGG